MEESMNTVRQQDALEHYDDKPATKREKGLVLAMVLVLAGVAALAVIGFLAIKPVPDTVQGQADATEIRISGKLPGRVAEIYVGEGQKVKAGDTLVHIHSSLMDAKMEQAQAMENAAAATNRKVDAGTLADHKRGIRRIPPGRRRTRHSREDIPTHGESLCQRCRVGTEA